MKISIIIPAYNIGQYIDRCLHSVISQEVQGATLECIVIDDGSRDDTLGAVRRFVDTHPCGVEFRVMAHEKNRGQSAARNTGLEAASGDYIFFLDGDDAIAPDGLSRLATLATKYPGVDIVQGNYKDLDEKYRTLELSQYCDMEYTSDREWLRYNIFHNLPVTVHNKLIRREFVEAHHLRFKESIIHEDNHWILQQYRYVSSMAFCYEPTYIYNVTEGSTMENPHKDYSFHSLLTIYREFMPSLDRQSEREMAISEMARLYKQRDRLREPERFLAEYNDTFHSLLTSGILDRRCRQACRYALSRSKWIKRTARLFDRPLYRLLKRCDR